MPKIADICQSLTKVIKSARLFAKICRNMSRFYFNIMLVWGRWGILVLSLATDFTDKDSH